MAKRGAVVSKRAMDMYRVSLALTAASPRQGCGITKLRNRYYSLHPNRTLVKNARTDGVIKKALTQMQASGTVHRPGSKLYLTVSKSAQDPCDDSPVVRSQNLKDPASAYQKALQVAQNGNLAAMDIEIVRTALRDTNHQV